MTTIALLTRTAKLTKNSLNSRNYAVKHSSPSHYARKNSLKLMRSGRKKRPLRKTDHRIRKTTARFTDIKFVLTTGLVSSWT